MRAGTDLTRRELLRRSAAAGLGLLGLGGLDAVPALAAAERREEAVPGVRRFVSRPDLRPPVLTAAHRSDGTASGYLFLAPSSGPGQRGPLIADDDGTPVWFVPTTPATTMNFRPAVYRGRPVLTWWQGKTEHGLGEGTHVILDSSYRVVARLPAGRGRPSDLHEFLLTPRGTALVTSWERVPMNLARIGGPTKGVVVGGIVQELELPSGRVLFEWRSLDHVPLDESHAGASDRGAYDYFQSTRSTSTATGTSSCRPAIRGPSTRSTAAAARSGGAWAASAATSRWGRARASRGSTTRVGAATTAPTC